MSNETMGHVLVVDDEASITALLRGWIDTSGFSLDSAANGLEALEIARKNPPDAILMDASMPVMGGFETLLELKKDPKLRHIPVIFLTVRNDVQDIVSALDTGAIDYMTKPFKPQILLARLRCAVRIKKQNDASLMQAEIFKNQLLRFLNDSPDCVVITDSHGLVEIANSKALKLLGKNNAEDVVGADISELTVFNCACPWKEEHPAEQCSLSCTVNDKAYQVKCVSSDNGGSYTLTYCH